MEKVLIIGGRRGLGAAVAQAWSQKFSQSSLVLTSRQEWPSPHRTFKADLYRDSDVQELESFLKTFKPDRVFCFAGGGPYGEFAKKAYKDHEWALKVSFLSPVRLMHAYLQVCPQGQWVMTGSAIAENSPDPGAASYAAAKHALMGLLSSLQLEKPNPQIRLFSPGYMKTDMLPLNSAPREAQLAMEPEAVAEDFIKWVLDAKASWHRVCRP